MNITNLSIEAFKEQLIKYNSNVSELLYVIKRSNSITDEDITLIETIRTQPKLLDKENLDIIDLTLEECNLALITMILLWIKVAEKKGD